MFPRPHNIYILIIKIRIDKEQKRRFFFKRRIQMQNNEQMPVVISIIFMRQSNLFLAELWVGKCHISQPTDKKIAITFRIGKNVSITPFPKIIEEGYIHFNTRLQLNTDKSALQTQRCSLTLSLSGPPSNSSIVGIVLLNIPKERIIPPKKTKLTQCPDKNAQIQFSLKISPLQQSTNSSPKTSSVYHQSQTSLRSIMAMDEFDRDIISPPKLFNLKSDISDRSNNYLLPPKPRLSREKSPNPLSISIHSQAIEEDRLGDLQKQCSCLKQLLKLEMSKNQQSNEIINKLTSALEQNTSVNANTSATELDQTLLLQEVQYSEQLDRALDKISILNQKIIQLTSQNQLLVKQNKQLQDLILKLSEMTQDQISIKNNMTANELKNNPKQLLKRLQIAEKSVNQSNKKFERLKAELANLQSQLLSKQDEFDRYKRKMKIQSKFSSLKHIDIQKSSNPTLTIKTILEREIYEKKQMIKLLLKFTKQDSDNSDGFIQKIKQKIQRSFNILVGKRLNKDILMIQKNQLLKTLQQHGQRVLIQ